MGGGGEPACAGAEPEQVGMNALGCGAMENRIKLLSNARWLGLRGLRRAVRRALLGLGLLATAGCASVDEWGRAKVYRPTRDQRSTGPGKNLLATRPDVTHVGGCLWAIGNDRITVLSVPPAEGVVTAVDSSRFVPARHLSPRVPESAQNRAHGSGGPGRVRARLPGLGCLEPVVAE